MSILSEVLDDVKRQSKSFSSKRELQNRNWVRFNEDGILEEKITYIFQPNDELLISKSGDVNKGCWKILNDNTLMIEIDNSSILYRSFKYDDGIILLNKDGTDVVITLVSEKMLEAIGKSFIEFIKEKVKPENQFQETSNELSEDVKNQNQNDDNIEIMVIIISVIVAIILMIAVLADIK